MSTVILGGGLSGLSAAYYLLKTHPKHSVQLLEASTRLGGWIKSNTLNNNIIFEEGPRTIRPHGLAAYNTLSLIQEIGLESSVIPIHSTAPAAKNRMIYADGQLHLLPSSISSIFKVMSPFSKPLVWYLMHDFIAQKQTVKDESIYDFCNRRFGTEVADYLISPMICGICAGNSKEISVKFLMKTLFEYEQKYGNIYKGLIRNLFNNSPKTELSKLAKRAKVERWSIYSFKDGLESLPRAIEQYIKKKDISIELNAKCKSIELYPRNITVHLDNGKSIDASQMISSISSEELSQLLKNQHPDLSTLLEKIKSVTVAVVNLQYNKKLLPKEGFGFLVPPKERLPILGVIFDSSCFPNGENTVLTVMMGGAWFQELFGKQCDKEYILNLAQEHLKLMLGINEQPENVKVNILEKCIPQYTVGHNENVEKIQKYIKENKLPLALCGSSYYGVGVNDVILSSKNAVEQLC